MMDETTIEQLAATLAHEVKNPLSLVMANLHLLEQEDSIVSNKIKYDIIKLELKKINELILQFLDLTRPIEQTLDLVYVSDIIKNIVRNYEYTYTNVKFSVYNNTDRPTIGDEKSLHILFNNLIKNAIEAIEEKNLKSGTVTVYIHEDVNDLLIKIEDTGCGIKEEVYDKVETEFFTTKKFGTGLGISICKKIVNTHQGEFAINNTKDGCIVKIKLPMY